jgi:hypothetical protein
MAIDIEQIRLLTNETRVKLFGDAFIKINKKLEDSILESVSRGRSRASVEFVCKTDVYSDFELEDIRLYICQDLLKKKFSVRRSQHSETTVKDVPVYSIITWDISWEEYRDPLF